MFIKAFTVMKLNVEGFIFGVRATNKIRASHPLIDLTELKCRAMEMWCQHLIDTGREQHIKSMEAFYKLRDHIQMVDKKRNEAVMRSIQNSVDAIIRSAPTFNTLH